MESYIRYGYYDQAYALTNYGVALQQHSIGKNPLIKVGKGSMLRRNLT